MTTVELRALTLSDLRAIEEIERRSYPTPWSRSMFAGELAKPSSICLGAFDLDGENGRLVGYLIVSRYVLHHLLDPAKRALVHESISWLRPGGRLVIADMMFGRGGTARDREILRQKATALAKKGPGGLWRIAKNLTRYGFGVGGEHPATPQFWQDALRDAGYADVTFLPVVAEAAIVSGTRP